GAALGRHAGADTARERARAIPRPRDHPGNARARHRGARRQAACGAVDPPQGSSARDPGDSADAPLAAARASAGHRRGGAPRRRRAAIPRYDPAVASCRAAVPGAFQEVEGSLAQRQVLGRESVAERGAADGAGETLAIAEKQYKAGTVDYLNVVSAQNAWLGAERAWRDITNRSLAASVGLLKALGGGWRSDALPLN